MFSRSQHLRGMGIEDPGPDVETEGTNLRAPAIIEQATLQNAESAHLKDNMHTLCDSRDVQGVTLKSREKSTSDDSGMEDTDWTKFKMEFSEKLQNSEDKVNSRQPPDDHVTSTNLRQQLLIDAITSLHSSRQGQQRDESDDQESLRFSTQSKNDSNIRALIASGDVKHQQALVSLSNAESIVKNTRNGTDLSEIPDEGQIECVMMSPSSQKSLLTLEAFDSIHEESLDHALMNIDATCSNSTRTSSGGSGLDLSSDKDPAPPREPKLAWSAPQDGGNETLMKELEQLSLAQKSNEVTSTASSKHKYSKGT